MLRTQPTLLPCFAWHDPKRGFSFTGYGVARVLKLEGDVDAPMDEISSWSRELSDGCGGVAPELPLVVAGAAFGPPRTRRVWGSWPRGYAFVPELIFFTQRDGCSGMICHDGAADNLAARDALAQHALTSFGTHPAKRRDAAPCSGPWRPYPNAQDYQQGVVRLLAAIRGGSLEKAVLARAATLSAPTGSVLSASHTALALRRRNPDAVSFALLLGPQCFLGATPEILAAVTGGVLESQAIAGTTTVADDPSGGLLCNSDKNRREQAYVTAGIVRSLEAWGSPSVSAPTVRRAGEVQHLVSELRLQLPAGIGVFEAAARLHPTAALCGAPRVAAESWIAAVEEIDRGWYGGPIGWCSPRGDGVMAVAIRSLLLSEQEATAFAGAGVVRGSQAASEWQETEDKLSAARAAIRLAPIDVAPIETTQGGHR